MSCNYSIFEVSFFGETKLCRAYIHNGDSKFDYEEKLLVSRDEDYYCLMSPQLKNKKVLVVNSRDWFSGLSIPS